MPRVKAICDRESPKAYRIFQGREDPVWIPKSQVGYCFKAPKDANGKFEITMEIPDWLSGEKNLREEMS